MRNFIDNVTNGDGIDAWVSSDYTNYTPSNDKPWDGFLRVNYGTIEYYEAYNNTWAPLTGQYATIGLSMETQQAISWVREKMEEEKRLEQLMEKNPQLADAKQKFDDELRNAEIVNKMNEAYD